MWKIDTFFNLHSVSFYLFLRNILASWHTSKKNCKSEQNCDIKLLVEVTVERVTNEIFHHWEKFKMWSSNTTSTSSIITWSSISCCWGATLFMRNGRWSRKIWTRTQFTFYECKEKLFFTFITSLRSPIQCIVFDVLCNLNPDFIHLHSCPHTTWARLVSRFVAVFVPFWYTIKCS